MVNDELDEQRFTDIQKNLLDHNYIINGLELSFLNNSSIRLSSGKCIISGYLIETTGSAFSIINSKDSSNANIYYIYLKLEKESGKLISSDTNGQYDGITFNLSNQIPSGDDILILGLYYEQEVRNTTIGYICPITTYKLDFNEFGISLDSSSGVTTDDISLTINDWLKTKFELNDGEIGET